jgi:hypothetical protein
MAIQQLPVPDTGGIPSGNTAGRPASPVIGDTYYNGQTEALEIYNGTAWVYPNLPAQVPTITVADVGVGRPFGSAQAIVTFIDNAFGGKPTGYTTTTSTGGYSATTTSSTAAVTVGTNGSWTFSATAYNDFGVSATSPTVSQTLTTIPEVPTIGTAVQIGGTTNATVTWTLGSNGGSGLTSIVITPYLNGTTAQTSQTAASTSATSYVFTGLTMGNSYTFKVKVVNANGTTVESSATNSITIVSTITVSFMHIIAGGASGGNYGSSPVTVGSGGGGAGGAKTFTNVVLQPGDTYTVTVGAGGARKNNSVGNAGSASSITGSLISGISTTGGGGGGGNGEDGANGGSGGGGARGSGGVGVSGEGNNGGGNSTSQNAGSGGGGKGGAGSTGSGNTGGNGGSSTTIEGIALAGGGGGAGIDNRGFGGGGGAGNGSTQSFSVQDANANTGSGGGGGTLNGYGGAGGSGTVILKYADGIAALTSTTGSPTYTTPTGFRMYQWTGSGSFVL